MGGLVEAPTQTQQNGVDGVVDDEPRPRVAERVRHLEMKNAVATPKLYFTPPRAAGHGGKTRTPERPNVEFVFPLHVRHFVRRKSNGGAIARPDTPILFSPIPEQETFIHAPRPERAIPRIVEPTTTALPLIPNDGATSAPNIANTASPSGRQA
jgi:hypothetical protein